MLLGSARGARARALIPRPGLFAALTCLAAAASPALYYGAGAAGLSYFVALVIVPAVAVLGTLRSGMLVPRRGGGAPSRRRRLSTGMALAAVPVALVTDSGLRFALGVDEPGVLTVASVLYAAVLVVGLGVVLGLRRSVSTRALLAAAGIAAAASGAFLVNFGIIGLVLVTAPLLLLAAAVRPPA